MIINLDTAALARQLGKHEGKEPSVQDLIYALKHSNPNVRVQAIDALAMVREDQSLVDAVEPLVETLKDKDESVSFAAACALGEISKYISSLVLVLIKALKDNDVFIRRGEAWALKENMRASNAVRALSEALEDDDMTVRENAAYAIEMIGMGESEAVIPALVKVLKERKQISDRLCLHAIQALGKCGKDTIETRNILTKIKEDDQNPTMRLSASCSLMHIGPEPH